MTACFVALDETDGTPTGYYTLAAGSIPLADIPPAMTAKLPRYPSVPIALLGRLAVDRNYHGMKLGAALLWDAAARAAHSDLMAFALVVDAKDGEAENFYRHHGFEDFGSLSRRLLMPLARVRSG